MTKLFCNFHWHEYRVVMTDIQFVHSVGSIGQQRMQVLSLNKVMVCLTVVHLVKSNLFTSHFEYFFPSLTPREFNSYGARRGNDAVMTRGTFASIKLQNRFIGKPGPKTLHIPSGQTVSGSGVVTFELKHVWVTTRPYMSSSCPSDQLDVFEAAERYQRDSIPLIILAGKDYGSGNSRDWVAKGPYLLVNFTTNTLHFPLTDMEGNRFHKSCPQWFTLPRFFNRSPGSLQGVRAVIAESFEKLHKNQLVGMGIMPLQFLPDQNADSLELSGKERFTITLPDSLSPRQQLAVKVGNRQLWLTVRIQSESLVSFFINCFVPRNPYKTTVLY